MVRTSWIYSLRREDLVQYLEEFSLDSTGTVEELRKRFSTFVSGEHKDEALARLEELEAKHGRSTSPGVSLEVPTVINAMNQLQITPPRTRNSLQDTPNPVPQISYAMVIDIVRKWSFRYDGGKDPLGFVERVEELAQVYELNIDMLPKTMPELLKDNALLWYRNNNKHWQCWRSFRQDFLGFFLPPRYFEELDDQIRKRQQKPRETFKNFVIEMQNLMRHAEYTERQQVERIFRNCLVEYQLYIRRTDFRTLEELIKIAEDLEILKNSHPEIGREYRENRQATHSREDRTRQVTSEGELRPINPSLACRRCGEEGHGYRFCQNPSVLFCWQCGRRGVRTRECCRNNSGYSGNAMGPRQEQGEASGQINRPSPQ